jgi:hypothetical protein
MNMAFDLESLKQKVNERLWNWKACMEGAGVGSVIISYPPQRLM